MILVVAVYEVSYLSRNFVSVCKLDGDSIDMTVKYFVVTIHLKTGN